MKPVGKRKGIQKAETRELILESARALFEAEGFEKTTMRAVALHAEIGLGTIYKHFTNKVTLLAAAFLGDLTHLYDSAMASIPANISIKEQFIHISRQFYLFYTSRPSLSRAYLVNISSMDEQATALINNFDASFTENLTILVAQAQKHGEISPHKNAAFVAMSLIADYFYVLGNHFLRNNETDPDRMLEILGKLLDQTVP
ncbi:MAG: TetR/AcrR family transcriptional regulator [Desulfobacterales bacterium]|nr:TetR/AcrR family transcriptional regulator [Desulfobacterales bacterium]